MRSKKNRYITNFTNGSYFIFSLKIQLPVQDKMSYWKEESLLLKFKYLITSMNCPIPTSLFTGTTELPNTYHVKAAAHNLTHVHIDFRGFV